MKTFSLVIIILLLIVAVVVLAWQAYGLIKAIIARRKAKKAKAEAEAHEDNRKE